MFRLGTPSPTRAPLARGRHTRRGGVSVALIAGLLLTAAAVVATIQALGARPPDGLPGWLGDPWQLPDEGSKAGFWYEKVSDSPRAYFFHHVLTPEECDHAIQLAEPRMAKSMVVDSKTGKDVDDTVRTSSGMFFKRAEDEVIKAIEERIADITFLPVEHGEGLQVLHYQSGQNYQAHFDYFSDKFNTVNGGQRQATFLMYLSDVEKGGETVFPRAAADKSRPDWDELTECGKTGLAVRPRKGDAILFFDMKPDGTMDPNSLHTACPVVRGHKWAMVKWIRERPFKS